MEEWNSRLGRCIPNDVTYNIADETLNPEVQYGMSMAGITHITCASTKMNEEGHVEYNRTTQVFSRRHHIVRPNVESN
jgi:hypothetical protein